jgi:hypothetical protein
VIRTKQRNWHPQTDFTKAISQARKKGRRCHLSARARTRYVLGRRLIDWSRFLIDMNVCAPASKTTTAHGVQIKGYTLPYQVIPFDSSEFSEIFLKG